MSIQTKSKEIESKLYKEILLTLPFILYHLLNNLTIVFRNLDTSFCVLNIEKLTLTAPIEFVFSF